MEFVEYLGSGVPRILQKYGQTVFNITDNFLCITFTFEKEILRKLKDQNKDQNKDTIKDTIKNLSESKKLIIEKIKENENITAEQLAEIIGINVRNLKKNIDKLKKKGILIRIGSRKSGEWKIISEE